VFSDLKQSAFHNNISTSTLHFVLCIQMRRNSIVYIVFISVFIHSKFGLWKICQKTVCFNQLYLR